MTALVAAVLAVVLAAPPAAGGDQAAEIIVDIRVHGNHVTSDADLIALTGLTIGGPFTATTLADVTSRLKAARKFETVSVLKRYASIDDPSKVLVVVIVDEGPVKVVSPDVPGGAFRVLKRSRLAGVMFMPILDGEDGYGLTYGVRLAYVGVTGRTSRLSFPLTWGGLKRAGAEFERTFASGPLSRVEIGYAIQRQHNPGFDADDDRNRVWGKAERAFGPVRASVTGGYQQVSFLGDDDTMKTFAASVTYDTRLNPVLPRNAVFASATWERDAFRSSGAIDRMRLDGRGYLGLIGQSVVVLRAVKEDGSEAVPLYLKSLLGGWSNLRGFEAGAYNGDTLVSGSLELRVPITEPLSIGKIGVSVFVDTGTVYGKGQKLGDQDLKIGAGGAVWMTMAIFRLGVSVAHGVGAGTRVNFGTGLAF